MYYCYGLRKTPQQQFVYSEINTPYVLNNELKDV